MHEVCQVLPSDIGRRSGILLSMKFYGIKSRDKLVNRHPVTWRGLDEQQRTRADSDNGAVGFLTELP